MFLFEIQVFISNKIAKMELGSLHFAPKFIHEKRMKKTNWFVFVSEPNQIIMLYNWILAFGSACVTFCQSRYSYYVCRMNVLFKA